MTNEPEDDSPVSIGRKQLADAIYVSTSTDAFVHNMGIYSLSYLIERVLDEHYPADIFGDGEKLYLNWSSNDPQAGGEIDPGVRWCNLLRVALKQLPRR
jgi:hypothetical protein